MKRPASFILIFLGAATVGWALFLLTVFPKPADAGKLPDGFVQPVVAFEFAQSGQEVLFIFVKAVTPETARAAMDRGHHLDFVFMALYGSFLFCFCLFHHLQEKSAAFVTGMGLALFAVAADVMENQQLLVLSHDHFAAGPIQLLPWFVNLKFGALALYFIVLFPLYWRLGWPGTVFSFLAPAAALTFTASLFYRGWLNELLVLLMAFEFFLLAVTAFRLFLSKRTA